MGIPEPNDSLVPFVDGREHARSTVGIGERRPSKERRLAPRQSGSESPYPGLSGSVNGNESALCWINGKLAREPIASDGMTSPVPN